MPGVRGNRLHDVTVREGVLRALDADGNVRLLLGRDEAGQYGFSVFDPTGQKRITAGTADDDYGLSVFDDTGAFVFSVDGTGLVYPSTPLSVRDVATFKSTTSATFADLWRAGVPVITANALSVSIPWSTDTGTTGDLRVAVFSGTPSSLVFVGSTGRVAIPAASSGFQVFNWLHSLPNGQGPYYFDVQARRTAGAANVNVYQPDFMALIGGDAVGATDVGF